MAAFTTTILRIRREKDAVSATFFVVSVAKEKKKNGAKQEL